MRMPAISLNPGKARLMVFSPMPPHENGIADYCAELLPELATAYEIYVVVDNHVPDPIIHPDWKVLHVAQFWQMESAFADANFLYHIGNNPDHDYLVPVLLKYPGILVLHDITLHHLIDQMTLRWDDVEGYCELLEREYGSPGQLLADQFRSHRTRERTMFYELPMIRLIASRSRVVIVHSWFGKTKVLAQEPDVPVEVIGHHLAHAAVEAERNLDRQAARELLQIDEDEVLLVSQGFITKAKQIDVVLETLARCRKRIPKIRYILAGKDQPENYNVRADIAQYGLQDIVDVTGYLDEEEFYTYSIAADIVINLRYPSGGETSGTLIRALGVGACVMVVDIGPFAEVPNNACVKVPWSDTFDMEFMRALMQLIEQPELRAKIGEAAKEYIQTHHSLAASGEFYRRTIKKYAERPVLAWSPDISYEYPPPALKEKILASLAENSVPPLWFKEMKFPIADVGIHCKTLVISEDDQCSQLLSRYLGYPQEKISTLSPEKFLCGAVYSRRSFQRALFAPKQYFSSEKLFYCFRKLNERLEHDGLLLISASALWPAAGSELRLAISEKLRSTGFKLIEYMASPQNFSFVLDTSSKAEGTEPFADHHPFWVATKVSEFIEPKLRNDSFPVTTEEIAA